MIPYIDPMKFDSRQEYSLNKKSDVYSVGVLLWEISSGRPPFCDESYNVSLAIKIANGFREQFILGTPVNYIKLYNGK